MRLERVVQEMGSHSVGDDHRFVVKTQECKGDCVKDLKIVYGVLDDDNDTPEITKHRSDIDFTDSSSFLDSLDDWIKDFRSRSHSRDFDDLAEDWLHRYGMKQDELLRDIEDKMDRSRPKVKKMIADSLRRLLHEDAEPSTEE